MCQKLWQPNFTDTKKFKEGYVWRCFCCGRLRKTDPFKAKSHKGKRK